MKQRKNYHHVKPRQREELIGITVFRRDNESFDSLLRRFKKQCTKHGILREITEREYFIKPSIKKRIEKKRNTIRSKKRIEELMSLLPPDKNDE